jgi:hypothetical protein
MGIPVAVYVVVANTCLARVEVERLMNDTISLEGAILFALWHAV